MDYDLQQPPANLGLTADELDAAFKHRLQVRYWPLRDGPCRPHVGWVRAWGHREICRIPTTILWVTGKAGFVYAGFCELAEVVEDTCNS